MSLVKSTHKKSPNQCSSSWRCTKYSGNGLFVTRHGSPAFLHVPPTASGKPVEDWSILLRPARISNRVAYPPENIIAVAEAREQCVAGVPFLFDDLTSDCYRTVHVHFFNLRDGSPHSSPTSNTITWELPPGSRLISARDMAITGSRIMMHYRLDEGQRSVWKIVVWNRKTGESVRFCDLGGHIFLNLPQVLDLSTVGNELVNKNTEAIFLNEFRVVIFDRWAITDSLVVFDTLVPQYHPQRLLFPLEFRNTSVGICVDHGRDLGTPDKDEVLLPDPAQAVLIIELGQDREHQMLLVVRTQILVNWVDSVRADYRVPWDEWGRDTVAIQVQNDGDHETFTFVRGAQVMIMRAPRGSGCYEVRTFDFSQRGRGSLPLRGGADGTGRTLFEDGINLRFEPGLFFGAFDALESFSDGSLIHLVSCLTHYVRSEVT